MVLIMKKIISLMLALILTAALAGCNTGMTPPAPPYNTANVYTPNPNNVNFNDTDMTTNFATDDPLYAMPNTSMNAGG
jgi:hypothetical protein